MKFSGQWKIGGDRTQLAFHDHFLSFYRVKVREGRFGELTEILAWYEYINDVILDHLDDEIKSTNKSGVWRYLISFKVYELKL